MAEACQNGTVMLPYARHPQTEVKEHMRAILVDWLVETHANLVTLVSLVADRPQIVSFALRHHQTHLLRLLHHRLHLWSLLPPSRKKVRMRR